MPKYTWFPGHMAKALREMKAKAKYADLVLEVRDARVSQGRQRAMAACSAPRSEAWQSRLAPHRPVHALQAPASTANGELEKIIKCKRRLVVLNKGDLADPLKTKVCCVLLGAWQPRAFEGSC
jgi:ribosome biogenesis GTPase A